jgi:hypothetical protein
MIRTEAPTRTYVVNAMALRAYVNESFPISSDGGGEIRIETRPHSAYGFAGFHHATEYHSDFLLVPQETLFKLLVHEWHSERGATSSITEMAVCRSYLRIIAMGPTAISLVLRQMESEGSYPDMWFVALQMLTGNDPVTDEIRGDFRAMAERWLIWARLSGYAW